MSILAPLCFCLVLAIVVLGWNLLGERRRNADLRDKNNSLNGMFSLIAQFERHLGKQDYSLALGSMITIVRGVKSNTAYWPALEFTDLGQSGYLSSRVRELICHYSETSPGLSLASEVLHSVKQLTGLGLHIEGTEVNVVFAKLEAVSLKYSAKL